MRTAFLILISILYTSVKGQISLTDTSRINFGISAMVNVPTLTPSIDNSAFTRADIENKLSLGGSLWSSYRFDRLSAYTKLSFRSINYTNTKINSRLISGDINLSLGLKYPMPKMEGLDVLFAYEPGYVLFANTSFTGKNDSVPPQNLASQYSNRLTHGLYAGFEFGFRANSSFEVGYSHILNQSTLGDYIDVIPHQLRFAYNFNFNQKAEISDDYLTMYQSLKALKNDTLYIINRACPSDFTAAKLDSLFAENYTFSSFKILNQADLQNGHRPNAVHYAIIGEYFASVGDPETVGIFLLDRDLQLTASPYPYHTGVTKKGNGLSTCLGEPENSAFLIRTFDGRLYKAEQ